MLYVRSVNKDGCYIVDTDDLAIEFVSFGELQEIPQAVRGRIAGLADPATMLKRSILCNQALAVARLKTEFGVTAAVDGLYIKALSFSWHSDKPIVIRLSDIGKYADFKLGISTMYAKREVVLIFDNKVDIADNFRMTNSPRFRPKYPLSLHIDVSEVCNNALALRDISCLCDLSYDLVQDAEMTIVDTKERIRKTYKWLRDSMWESELVRHGL